MENNLKKIDFVEKFFLTALRRITHYTGRIVRLYHFYPTRWVSVIRKNILEACKMWNKIIFLSLSFSCIFFYYAPITVGSFYECWLDHYKNWLLSVSSEKEIWKI